MKTIFFLFLSIVGCLGQLGDPAFVGALSSVAPVSTLNTSLVAYWKLDEYSDGSGLVDRSATYSALTLTDTNKTASAAGIISNGADFETTITNLMYVASDPVLSPGDANFSISCWVKCESLPATSATRYVLGKWYTYAEYDLHMYNSAGVTRFRWQVSNDGTTLKTVTANAFGGISTATWYHVVVWHDAAANFIGISVNGTADTTSHTTGIYQNSSAPFVLGYINAAGGNQCFDGIIDEVGVWSKVLSSSEITELYNAGSGKTCCPF